MMAEQGLLWEPERQAIVFVDEDGPYYPFQHQGASPTDWEVSHCRFSYWEQGRFYFAPATLRVSFWKDDKTEDGKLQWSVNGLPAIEKGLWSGVLSEWEAGLQEAVVPVKPKKPRKRYKWSKAALVRNRQKRLRKRIEKKHGYDPDRPTLFDDDLRMEIELEFMERITQNKVYFVDGGYNDAK